MRHGSLPGASLLPNRLLIAYDKGDAVAFLSTAIIRFSGDPAHETEQSVPPWVHDRVAGRPLCEWAATLVCERGFRHRAGAGKRYFEGRERKAPDRHYR